MRLSTRARYGLRAMIDLAVHAANGPSSAEAIGRRTGISEKYLQNILYSLKGQKLINTTRGPNGGYILARPAEMISAGEVVAFLEGDVGVIDCVVSPRTCERTAACASQELWGEISCSIKSILDSRKLSDLATRHRAIQEARTSYEI